MEQNDPKINRHQILDVLKTSGLMEVLVVIKERSEGCRKNYFRQEFGLNSDAISKCFNILSHGGLITPKTIEEGLYITSLMGAGLGAVFEQVFTLLNVKKLNPQNNLMANGKMASMIEYMALNPEPKIKNDFRTQLEMPSTSVDRNIGLLIAEGMVDENADHLFALTVKGKKLAALVAEIKKKLEIAFDTEKENKMHYDKRIDRLFAFPTIYAINMTCSNSCEVKIVDFITVLSYAESSPIIYFKSKFNYQEKREFMIFYNNTYFCTDSFLFDEWEKFGAFYFEMQAAGFQTPLFYFIAKKLGKFEGEEEFCLFWQNKWLQVYIDGDYNRDLKEINPLSTDISLENIKKLRYKCDYKSYLEAREKGIVSKNINDICILFGIPNMEEHEQLKSFGKIITEADWGSTRKVEYSKFYSTWEDYRMMFYKDFLDARSKKYRKIEDYFNSRQWEIPTGEDFYEFVQSRFYQAPIEKTEEAGFLVAKPYISKEEQEKKNYARFLKFRQSGFKTVEDYISAQKIGFSDPKEYADFLASGAKTKEVYILKKKIPIWLKNTEQTLKEIEADIEKANKEKNWENFVQYMFTGIEKRLSILYANVLNVIPTKESDNIDLLQSLQPQLANTPIDLTEFHYWRRLRNEIVHNHQKISEEIKLKAELYYDEIRKILDVIKK